MYRFSAYSPKIMLGATVLQVKPVCHHYKL